MTLKVLNEEQKKLFETLRRFEAEVLPVSKGQSPEHIEKTLQLLSLPRRLGENYLEELQGKAQSIKNIEWHFLGRLQGRKIAEICNVADVLHTVSREKELKIISEQKKIPKFFVQVNISEEKQKNGIDPAELGPLMQSISQYKLSNHFLGFMGMAAPLETVGEEEVQKSFTLLRQLRDEWAPNKKLSMGMSSDYKIALEMGSNLIRVGTLIFGERKAF